MKDNDRLLESHTHTMVCVVWEVGLGVLAAAAAAASQQGCTSCYWKNFHLITGNVQVPKHFARKISNGQIITTNEVLDNRGSLNSNAN